MTLAIGCRLWTTFDHDCESAYAFGELELRSGLRLCCDRAMANDAEVLREVAAIELDFAAALNDGQENC